MLTVTHVRQPMPTSCVQACIAMLTGIPVHDLIASMTPGRATGTKHKTLIQELRRHGISCGDRFLPVRGKPLPDFAIVRIVYPNKRGHVVVKYGRTWHDPGLEGPFDGDPPRGAVTPWAGGARITSALWIDQRTP